MRQQENHPEWILSARCANDSQLQRFMRVYKIDLFYEPKLAEFAKNYCSSCPVRAQCGYWATIHQEAGVWGAQTQRMRTQKANSFHKALAEIVARSQALSQDDGNIPNAS